MTVQLSKDQIAALRVELKKYGLNVLPLPKSRGGTPGAKTAAPADDPIERQIARLRKMKFKTAGVKAGIIKTLKLAQRVREARKRPNLGALLAMFGVKLQAVATWPEAGPDQNWQALRNGLPRGTLALPAPEAPGEIHYASTWSGPRKQIKCVWYPA